MNKIKFQDIKEELEAKLIDVMRETKTLVGESGGFTLVEGFMTQPLQTELSGNVIIGGPSIPVICIVGNDSGRMYFFALKALLPNIKI